MKPILAQLLSMWCRRVKCFLQANAVTLTLHLEPWQSLTLLLSLHNKSEWGRRARAGETFSSLCERSTMEDCETFVKSAKRPCSYSISIETNSGICQNASDCDCAVNSCVLHVSDTRSEQLVGCRDWKPLCVTKKPESIFSLQSEYEFVLFSLSSFSNTFHCSTKTLVRIKPEELAKSHFLPRAGTGRRVNERWINFSLNVSEKSNMESTPLSLGHWNSVLAVQK